MPDPATPSPTADPVVVEATLEAIFLSPGHDFKFRHGQGRLDHGIASPEAVRAVAGMGLEGDRYFGEEPGGIRQVTFIDADVIDRVRSELDRPDLPASGFRRNLVVRGMDLPALMERRFVFQGITFEGTMDCKPCQWMDTDVAPGSMKALSPPFFGGLRARILTDGTLRVDPRTDR